MKSIVVFPAGSLDKADKDRLSKAGYVPIEAADPAKIKVLIPGDGYISDSDLLMSALGAMSDPVSSAERARFTSLLYQRLKAREEKS